MTDVSDAMPRSAMGGIQALVSREAGYSVAAKCLSVQAEAEAQDPTLRTSDRLHLHPDAWSWYQGALGEMHVGQLLASLGPEWRVLHSVPIGNADSDVDHLLVGPNGVFVLNTKHHEDASVWVGEHVVKVNRSNTKHIWYAMAENKKVTRLLEAKVGFKVYVQSVIVLVGELSVTYARNPGSRSIAVVSSEHLLEWLVEGTPAAPPSQLQLIRLAAEEPDTWHTDPHRADSLRVMHRFERLVDAVGYSPPREYAPEAVVAKYQRAVSRRPSAARAAPPHRTGTARPASGSKPSRTSKRAQRAAQKQAEAIVGLGAAAVVLIMVANGSWMPFMTGLLSLLSPTP